MSKINAVRFINLNYNNNAMSISDETFDLKGESTLLSLRNGGGKSVLVQMMIAPYVHARYRNTKDRLFASYFTTNKPTFILVEWVLDHGAGYVLTGMMVRKNQDISQDNAPELEMINLIAEYKERCALDIYHLPVVERTKKTMTLKNFGTCRQLFETWKKEREIPFFYYDMNNAAQSRQYFDKLMEYQINYKEWETIIKKVNIRESGLSELFSDCKDERGLVEKWFLEAVENKLNKDKNRMQEFQEILEKYTVSYKDNQSKIKRRDTIRAFEKESEKVRETMDAYGQTIAQREAQEGKIADFIRILNSFYGQEEEKRQASKDRCVEYEDRLSRLIYEKISGEIHAIEKEERYLGSNWEMIQMEQEALERAKEEFERKLHLLDCAKQQEEVNEAKEENDNANERLLLLKEEIADTEPERKKLGGQLWRFYRQELGQNESRYQESTKQLGILQEKIKSSGQEQEDLRGRDKEFTAKRSVLSERIKQYDEKETQFNGEYKQNWSRNILGEYEPGFMAIQGELLEKELTESRKIAKDQQKNLEDLKEKERMAARQLEDKRQEKLQLETAVRDNEKEKEEYERELAERKNILSYFELGEEALFEIQQILTAADRKIKESDAVRRNFEREADEMTKEYQKLAQGRILELSEEFARLLEEAGIRYIYGMEWLQRNQYSAQENEKLIKQKPFLPYAIIITGKELARLKNLENQVYTSSPVPILLRESLENGGGSQEGAILTCQEVSFYLWFNENLLDEEKLAKLLKEKEEKLAKLKKKVEQKQQEYTSYVEKRQQIVNQKVTKENFEEVQSKGIRLVQKLGELEKEIGNVHELRQQIAEELSELENAIKTQEAKIVQFERRMAAFSRMEEAYSLYLENRREKGAVEQQQSRLENQMKLIADRLNQLMEQRESVKNEIMLLRQQQVKLEEKCQKYRAYEQMDKADQTADEEILDSDNVGKAESRYDVITSGIAGEQKQLEELCVKTRKRLDKKQKDLSYLQKKYSFLDGAWSGISYDRHEEMHLESMIEDKSRGIEAKREQIKETEIQMALLKSKKSGKFVEMQKRCQMEQPLAMEEIETIDFEQAIGELEHKKDVERKKQEEIERTIRIYEENLTALAEYEHFVCRVPVEWEIDWMALKGNEWKQQKGILIRDYNDLLQQVEKNWGRLSQALNQMIRKEEFQDEFYRKPLESMLELSRNEPLVRKQLDTTLASYGNLMEKLLVDISFVEKEKEKIVELMGDYLKEVHVNLGKIDHNSTITVREKPVKMLKIGLPDWMENESLFQLRLSDYMDDVTRKSVALLEENQNAMEFIGTKITTRGLYDAVVGIANVQIRLYKIEAQREYAITWADVAKNSGGEGFLSAFVILSSLLYYMRKDDTDLFADRNEGKVLVMDNPFAQTNASHLLKPLMDMAGKTNTQLICLSGLGGESIYNRFDNIYVLNLIASNLRNGMQYLKADHMKGSDNETMIVSNVEVVQQELVF